MSEPELSDSSSEDEDPNQKYRSAIFMPSDFEIEDPTPFHQTSNPMVPSKKVTSGNLQVTQTDKDHQDGVSTHYSSCFSTGQEVLSSKDASSIRSPSVESCSTDLAAPCRSSATSPVVSLRGNLST